MSFDLFKGPRSNNFTFFHDNESICMVNKVDSMCDQQPGLSSKLLHDHIFNDLFTDRSIKC